MNPELQNQDQPLPPQQDDWEPLVNTLAGMLVGMIVGAILMYCLLLNFDMIQTW